MPSLLLVKVGFVVSTLTDKTLEAELVLPSASVALAVMSVEVNGDEASVTYTLRAVDLNKFNINAESGVVTYKITPNVVPGK
jgi:hypothetical protein